MKPTRLLSAWLPPLAYMLFIFFLSAQGTIPSLIQPLLHLVKDKSLHACEYGALALLFVRAGRLQFPRGCVWRIAVFAAAAAVLYGMTDEWHQMYVPGRDASPWDLLADFVGASLAVGGYLWWYRRHYGSLRTCAVSGAE